MTVNQEEQVNEPQDTEDKEERAANLRIQQLIEANKADAKANSDRINRLKQALSENLEVPDPENFDGGIHDYGYKKALSAHKKAVDYQKEEEREKNADAVRKANLKAWRNDLNRNGVLKFKDFRSVVEKGNILSKFVNSPIVNVLEESDMREEIIYHLSKKPELAARIAAGTPEQQLRKIGRLEAELENLSNLTNMPPNTSSGKSKGNIDTENLSLNDRRSSTNWAVYKKAEEEYKKKKNG